MFIETLFLFAKNWKKPKCASAGKWIINEILHHNKVEEMTNTP